MAGPFIIRTPRLELIAGNHEIAEAEMTSIVRFSSLLKADFPFGWPPPENDESTMEWFFKKIFDNPEARGWLMWYFVSTEKNKRIVVGSGGFTGMPKKDGIVECGYSILEPLHHNGYATEALNGLVNWAFSDVKVKKIVAKTLENNQASKKVLTNNAFRFAGKDTINGQVVYNLERSFFISSKAKTKSNRPIRFDE